MSKKEQYVQFILGELEKGVTKKVQISSNFCKHFKKSERTFNTHWKAANERHLETLRKTNEARERIYIETAEEAARKAIKSKFERIELLQRQLEQCYKDLAEGKTNDSFIDSKKSVKEFRRNMTIDEINRTRKNAKELSSEISSLMGDYAPKKIQHEGEIPLVIINDSDKSK